MKQYGMSLFFGGLVIGLSHLFSKFGSQSVEYYLLTFVIFSLYGVKSAN